MVKSKIADCSSSCNGNSCSVKICDVPKRNNIKKKLHLVIKIYITISIVFSTMTNIYVILKYTLKENGGIFSIQYLLYNIMELVVVYFTDTSFNSGNINHFFNEKSQKRFKKCKLRIILFFIAFVTSPLIFVLANDDLKSLETHLY